MYRKKSTKIKKISVFSSSKDLEFDKLKGLFDEFKEKYNLTSTGLLNKIEEKEILIPIIIFSKELSCLETVVKYLRENLELSNKEIAKLLKRSEKTIYQAYNSGRKKLAKKFEVEFSQCYIPTSILANRRLSVLESIARFLHENYNLSYSEISRLLHRNPRTIWTVYQRARKKNVK